MDPDSYGSELLCRILQTNNSDPSLHRKHRHSDKRHKRHAIKPHKLQTS